jgi:hypothetical protein
VRIAEQLDAALQVATSSNVSIRLLHGEPLAAAFGGSSYRSPLLDLMNDGDSSRPTDVHAGLHAAE